MENNRYDIPILLLFLILHIYQNPVFNSSYIFLTLVLNCQGSLLIGTSREEQPMLEERVKVLSQAGVRAQYLSSHSLCSEEPALDVGTEGAAVFVPDDCQLDAYQTVSFIQKVRHLLKM